MSNNVLFSIVVPTYNRAGFIEKTIQSILTQSYENFEIIVVDDGSTDNTKQIVQTIKDPRVHYYYKENEERGAARNFGAKKAKGAYLNFFDSDDIAYSNHLLEAYRLIQKHGDPEVVVLSYDIKNTNNQITSSTPTFKNLNQQLIKANLLSCNGVFLKTEVALDYPFSENRKLSASEDYLLWLQLASRFDFKFTNTKTSAIISHEERSVIKINKEALIHRKELMLKFALEDSKILNIYGKKMIFLKENTYSYIALHLALNKDRKDSLRYLLKAVKARPGFVFSKRFFATLKHLI